jgi:hypothetical protein
MAADGTPVGADLLGHRPENDAAEIPLVSPESLPRSIEVHPQLLLVEPTETACHVIVHWLAGRGECGQ